MNGRTCRPTRGACSVVSHAAAAAAAAIALRLRRQVEKSAGNQRVTGKCCSNAAEPVEQAIRQTDTLTDVGNLHNDNNATANELPTSSQAARFAAGNSRTVDET